MVLVAQGKRLGVGCPKAAEASSASIPCIPTGASRVGSRPQEARSEAHARGSRSMGTLDTKVLALITKSLEVHGGQENRRRSMPLPLPERSVRWAGAVKDLGQGTPKNDPEIISSHACMPAMRHDAGANSGGAGLAATV